MPYDNDFFASKSLKERLVYLIENAYLKNHKIIRLDPKEQKYELKVRFGSGFKLEEEKE